MGWKAVWRLLGKHRRQADARLLAGYCRSQQADLVAECDYGSSIDLTKAKNHLAFIGKVPLSLDDNHWDFYSSFVAPERILRDSDGVWLG